MTIDAFLFLLMAVSIMTSLFTEALKKLLMELKCNYHANILAGVVAAVLSIAMDAGYMVMMDAAMTSRMAVLLIALVLLSWLSAMIGYDKVVQGITQIMGSSGKVG